MELDIEYYQGLEDFYFINVDRLDGIDVMIVMLDGIIEFVVLIDFLE